MSLKRWVPCFGLIRPELIHHERNHHELIRPELI